MSKSYVTYLGSDDFLPGVLVVYQSLINVKSYYDLIVMVTPEISNEVIKYLKKLDVKVKLVNHIYNPENPITSAYFELKNSYTKLHLFNLTEFQKLVYIDGDMLVCNNIDELFEKPHLSAVNAGGLLPEHADWIDLNAGLLVIEPSHEAFNDLMMHKGILSSKNCGDQGFLHSYFPEWPKRSELHLDHKYNLYVGHLKRYSELFNYVLPNSNTAITKNAKLISVLHFWGDNKPWSYDPTNNKNDYNIAFEMWWDCFDFFLNRFREINFNNPPMIRQLEKVLIDKGRNISRLTCF